MNLQRDTLKAFTDAAADAIARAIAGVQREAARERELRDAQFSAKMAEFELRLAAVSEVERRMEERLASVKDGKKGNDGAPGKDADPEEIRRLVTEAVAAAPPAENGKNADPELVASLVAEAVERAVAAIPAPQNGQDGTDGRSVEIDDLRPVIAAEVDRAVQSIEKPESGVGIAKVAIDDNGDLIVTYSTGATENAGRALGWDGVDVDIDGVYERVRAMFDAIPKPKDGIDGRDGKDGKLPKVRLWVDAVHYEGDTVTYDGGVYQALRDTGKVPGSEDWLCIVERGRDGSNGADGRSLNVRGTWQEGAEYSRLDIVALNGASFIAKNDEPGACPGEGWQLVASQGKQGKPGDRGMPIKGERGQPGQPVVAANIDGEGLLTLTNGDGSIVTCDLYPLLSKLGRS